MSWLDMLLGNSYPTKVYKTEEDKSYPDEKNVEAARKADLFYGDKVAGYTEPGATVPTAPSDGRGLLNFLNKGMKDTGEAKGDQTLAEDTARDWLASQRSAISALGFDPSRMAVSRSLPKTDRQLAENPPVPPKKKDAATALYGKEPQESPNLTIAGAYSPKADIIWTDPKDKSVAVHESIHRGVRRVLAAGYEMPKIIRTGVEYSVDQEILTRALMYRLYGDIERTGSDINNKQVTEGKRFAESSHGKKVLDELEAKAAELYARERGKGPK